MSKTAKARAKVAANPATTTSSVGVIVALIGRYLGWSDETQAQVVTLFLVATPLVRFIVGWFQARAAKA